MSDSDEFPFDDDEDAIPGLIDDASSSVSSSADENNFQSSDDDDDDDSLSDSPVQKKKKKKKKTKKNVRQKELRADNVEDKKKFEQEMAAGFKWDGEDAIGDDRMAGGMNVRTDFQTAKWVWGDAGAAVLDLSQTFKDIKEEQWFRMREAMRTWLPYLLTKAYSSQDSAYVETFLKSPHDSDTARVSLQWCKRNLGNAMVGSALAGSRGLQALRNDKERSRLQRLRANYVWPFIHLPGNPRDTKCQPNMELQPFRTSSLDQFDKNTVFRLELKKKSPLLAQHAWECAFFFTEK